MSVQENKRIVLEMINNWDNWTDGPCVEHLADDFQYEHRCNGETFPVELIYYGKQSMIDHCHKMLEVFPDTKRTPINVVAEGDQVVVENFVTGHAPGREQPLEVHAIDIFEVRDGKVVSQREYSDTAYLVSLWADSGDYIRGEPGTH